MTVKFSSGPSVTNVRPARPASIQFLYVNGCPAARLGDVTQHAACVGPIPMPTGKVRSLNLSTAVGIVVYEALRQTHDW